MKFIQKDFNKRLFILVIVLLILLSAFTIYYEVTLRSVLGKYNKDQEIYGEFTANIVVNELNKTSNLKENVQKYKEYLEKKYDDLNSLNQNLKGEIENLKAELSLVKSQIEYQKAKEIGPTSQFRLFQEKVDEIDRLKKKIMELCSKLEADNASDSACIANNGD